MKAGEFLSKLAQETVVAAIAETERQTSGEIRVYISRLHRPDGLAAARERFVKLRMHETRERNAVLIYVAPTAQTFAVLGDEAAYALCRQDLWNEVRQAMTVDFKAGRYSEGVVRAVKLVGEELRRHFPRRPDDRNELPDKVATD
jgi:uncharacterized membrane protein